MQRSVAPTSRVQTRKITRGTRVIHQQERFADCVNRVEALSRTPQREDEGPGLFLRSRSVLERDLDSLESDSRKREDFQVTRGLANVHCLLALVHWLCPNSVEFDRKENAQRTLEHSTKACEYASSSGSADEALSLGLFVQLRVLPYLVRSKSQSVGALIAARRSAEDLIGRLESTSRFDLAGLLSDALGFSYYQLEHDRETAIHHAQRAFDYLLSSHESGNHSSSSPSTLVSNMISVSLWDLGTFYESLAEEAEGAKALDLFRKAGSKYSMSISLSREKGRTWCIYTAFSRYGLAGSLVREVELRPDLSLKEKRKLAWKAFSLADKAFSELKKWSTREARIIAASTNSLFYQKLADLYKTNDCKNMKLIRQSGQVTSNKELGSAPNADLERTTRYSAANLADISLRRAVFYYERARTGGAQKSKDLSRSLENCLESQKNFDVERHANRLVESLLLGAKICHDIAAQLAKGRKIARSKEYSRLARDQCQKSIAICQKLGWSDRLTETNRLLASFS